MPGGIPGMGILAPPPFQDWPGEAYSKQQIRDKLVAWREYLLESKQGSNIPTRQEIWSNLDHWLDQRLELRGR